MDSSSPRERRLLITGGTGFVGRSILTHWNGPPPGFDRVTLLARDPARFASSWSPAAELPWLDIVEGDVIEHPPSLVSLDGIIHAAWEPAAASDTDGSALIERNVRGTKNTFELAASHGPIPVLFTSSGAVYGSAGNEFEKVPEDAAADVDESKIPDPYGLGKRLAERECVAAAQRLGILPKIARMFAFVGPHLPLAGNFAIGNFIRDALAGGPIVVRGDGSAVRSYLDADEMVDWLWAIFDRGTPTRPYNVGSERSVDIASLARLVATRAGCPGRVEILGESGPHVRTNRYVPDTERVRGELGVRETVSLEAAIDRAIASQEDFNPKLR
jgi:dTDP-glucose 4,6-dehydratase